MFLAISLAKPYPYTTTSISPLSEHQPIQCPSVPNPRTCHFLPFWKLCAIPLGSDSNSQLEVSLYSVLKGKPISAMVELRSTKHSWYCSMSDFLFSFWIVVSYIKWWFSVLGFHCSIAKSYSTSLTYCCVSHLLLACQQTITVSGLDPRSSSRVSVRV